MTLDPKNLKIIDASDVPTGRKRTVWDDVFDAISEGKAVVLDGSEINHSNVRQALRSRQKKGLYQNYRVTTKGSQGSITIYIIHDKLE